MTEETLREQRERGRKMMEDAENMIFGEEPVDSTHQQHKKDHVAVEGCEFCPQVELVDEEASE